MRLGLVTVVGVLVLAGIGTVPAGATPGQLVSSFGKGGIVRADSNHGVGNEEDSVAVDRRRRIIVLATSKRGDAVLLRFRASGALDSDFGGGKGAVQLPGGPWHDLAVQSNNAIVVAGSVDGAFSLARYDEFGVPDVGFGRNGLADFALNPGMPLSVGTSLIGAFHDVLIQPDGKIVAAGNGAECEPLSGICIAHGSVVGRFMEDGFSDPAFGRDGFGDAHITRPRPFPHQSGRVEALALDRAGKILVAGTNGRQPVLSRLTASGSVDLGFATGGAFAAGRDTPGHLSATTYGGASAVVVQGRRRIVVVGRRALIGMDRRGRLDRSFGTNGIAFEKNAAQRGMPALADGIVGPSGRIVVAGHAGGKTAIARFLPNGPFDASFAGDGIAYIDVTKEYLRSRPAEGATELVQMPNGTVLAVGFSLTGVWNRLAIVNLAGGLGRLGHCQGKRAAIQGTPGDDRLFGFGPIVGFGGNDLIRSYDGPVCAGDGDDTVYLEGPGSGNGYGGPGDDRIKVGRSGRAFGGPGDDEISTSGLGFPSLFHGGPGSDRLLGGKGADRLHGDRGDDRIHGRDGRDILWGDQGDDLLRGGRSRDRLNGGSGKDRLID